MELFVIFTKIMLWAAPSLYNISMSKYRDDFKKRFQVSVSTARSQLITNLLFNFAQQLGKDICHRCNQKIERESFSIEHIKPWAWEPNGYDLFMDMDNIAFSHLTCNSGHTRFTERSRAAASSRGNRRIKGDQLECSSCLKTKDKADFHKNKTTPSGHESLCKPCRKAKRKPV